MCLGCCNKQYSRTDIPEWISCVKTPLLRNWLLSFNSALVNFNLISIKTWGACFIASPIKVCTIWYKTNCKWNLTGLWHTDVSEGTSVSYVFLDVVVEPLEEFRRRMWLAGKVPAEARLHVMPHMLLQSVRMSWKEGHCQQWGSIHKRSFIELPCILASLYFFFLFCH